MTGHVDGSLSLLKLKSNILVSIKSIQLLKRKNPINIFSNFWLQLKLEDVEERKNNQKNKDGNPVKLVSHLKSSKFIRNKYSI